MQSVFTNKLIEPSQADLKNTLGETLPYWEEVIHYTTTLYKAAVNTWQYAGDKYGWNFRVRDKKRVLVYLLPHTGFFEAAFVFGEKATTEILRSELSEAIKQELRAAKPYAEGRGIRIAVRKAEQLPDLRKLIDTKLRH